MRVSAARSAVTCLLVAVWLLPRATAAADPGEVERLRAENARLAERVRALEAERDRLLERCPPAMAAAVERAADEKVAVTLDRTGGDARATTERSRLVRTAGGHSKHWLTVRARRGAAPGNVTEAALVIDADASGGIYRGVRTLGLTVDGRTEELAVADYAAAQITTGARTPRPVSVAETVTVGLPPDTLARLAAASEVTGTLGSTAFRFTPEQLLAVRALAQRLEGR